MSSTKLSLKEQREREKLKKLEEGFTSNVKNEKRKEYNALHDPNMRHFFENRRLQMHLYRAGMIDRQGRVIDYEKNKSKIAIIEQEFRMAEKAEALRRKEEEEMRRRVQIQRQEALENARRMERLQKIKEDQRIRREIIQATRESQCGSLEGPSSIPKSRTPKNKSRPLAQQGESFFLTEAPMGAEEEDNRDYYEEDLATPSKSNNARPETGDSYASDFTHGSNNDALDNFVEQRRVEG